MPRLFLFVFSPLVRVSLSLYFICLYKTLFDSRPGIMKLFTRRHHGSLKICSVALPLHGAVAAPAATPSLFSVVGILMTQAYIDRPSLFLLSRGIYIKTSATMFTTTISTRAMRLCHISAQREKLMPLLLLVIPRRCRNFLEYHLTFPAYHVLHNIHSHVAPPFSWGTILFPFSSTSAPFWPGQASTAPLLSPCHAAHGVMPFFGLPSCQPISGFMKAHMLQPKELRWAK